MKGPRSRGSQIYLVQLFAVLIGLGLVVAGPWREGVAVVGGAFLLGAVARSVVPVSHTGMLRVRGKVFDVVWMSLLGTALIVLPILIPNQPG